MKLDLLDALYWYRCEYIRAKDGDTVEVWLEFGFGVRWKTSFRFLNVNTPERRGATKKAGDAARDYLISLLKPSKEAGTLYVRSYRDHADKYGGRYLGEFHILQEDGSTLNVNQRLVEAGHAVPFMVVDE